MKEIIVDAVVENIEKVIDFINAELEQLGFPMKAQIQIDVAADEILCNIARYAYAPGTGTATVRIEPEADSVSVSFIDGGKPFNPLDAPEPDVTLSLEERQIGGLGIFLVRKTMDDVAYEYTDGKNCLTIKKNRV